MHQTIRIQAEAALEGNQSSVGALFLFLLPEGLYLDDYELEVSFSLFLAIADY